MNINESEPITGPGLLWAREQIFKMLERAQVNGDCHAVVTVAEQGFKSGQEIELTETEKDLARCAIKRGA